MLPWLGRGDDSYLILFVMHFVHISYLHILTDFQPSQDPYCCVCGPVREVLTRKRYRDERQDCCEPPTQKAKLLEELQLVGKQPCRTGVRV